MLAGIAIILLSPAMLMISALLYGFGFSRPIFTQQRVGQNGQVFTIFKFRTLRDQTCRPVCGFQSRLAKAFTSALRVCGFDELPQLFNILRGEMALIGPRPHSIADHLLFASSLPGYEARLKVKPGITGWAQICGWRGPVRTFEHLNARVRHDLVYIKHGNAAFDGAIVIATVLLPIWSVIKRIKLPRQTVRDLKHNARQCDGRIA
ncbi:sugar transferase [Thalassospira lucentensis]|uniref:sugar transferase n=1 Tax=Thalassospira lucentensis TaxID=168935 RepID=UPI003D2EDB4A